jgi:hypothetical protein
MRTLEKINETHHLIKNYLDRDGNIVNYDPNLYNNNRGFIITISKPTERQGLISWKRVK